MTVFLIFSVAVAPSLAKALMKSLYASSSSLRASATGSRIPSVSLAASVSVRRRKKYAGKSAAR